MSVSILFHPERYHGHKRRPPFFEGWYFKLVDAAQQQRLAIIPAIFKHKDPAKHHAFIQILDGLTGSATYHRFPVEAFTAAHDRFAVDIAGNHFSDVGVSLDIRDDQRSIRGAITLHGLQPWPVTWRSLGIMGPYGWLPNMECNHGVVSLDHELRGELEVDGQRIDFTGGRGYLEKDWGASFPAGYVWLQTNHFDQAGAGTSFVGSIAIIPWLRTAFPGFIIGLLHKGRLYRFATYTGAKTVSLRIEDQLVHWVVQDRTHQLTIIGRKGKGGLLLGPNRDNMTERVGETMLGEVSLAVVERKSGRIVMRDTGRCAGMEVHGEIERLLALQK